MKLLMSGIQKLISDKYSNSYYHKSKILDKDLNPIEKQNELYSNMQSSKVRYS